MGQAIEQSVKVSLGDRSYDITIRAGLLDDVGVRLSHLGFSGKVAIVTDRHVAERYLKKATRSIKGAGFEVHSVVVPAGEQSKTVRWTERIVDVLVRAQFERKSLLVALGGGVVGDLVGFAASVYLRGIPFVQMPTTLVAQVDSSVGGKTGVNHPLGKNLIGAFHQPRAVLIDPATLSTLPKREWVAGLAEVIKYGVIEDEQFFAYLEQQMSALLGLEPATVLHVVKRSCEIKAQVVEEDERESDRRRILNFGHTVGHALESLGSYRTLIHGEAVAIGMVQEADLARHLGICGPEVVERIRKLVLHAGLREALPPVTFRSLWGAMQHDKKVSGGTIYGVWPERIGKVGMAPLERAACQSWFVTQGLGKRRIPRRRLVQRTISVKQSGACR